MSFNRPNLFQACAQRDSNLKRVRAGREGAHPQAVRPRWFRLPARPAGVQSNAEWLHLQHTLHR